VTRTGATLFDAKGAILAQGVGVHQTALYDMVLVGLLFALLWRMQKRPRREGVLTLTFGLFYGCFRLLEDSLRIDKRFGPFTGSQWTALVVAVLSAAILLWWRFHPLPADAGGDDEVLQPEDREAPAPEEPEPDPDPLT
jgi:prolipoprotein diacylglyceryltransferase